jgi:hypothetical protein
LPHHRASREGGDTRGDPGVPSRLTVPRSANWLGVVTCYVCVYVFVVDGEIPST